MSVFGVIVGCVVEVGWCKKILKINLASKEIRISLKKKKKTHVHTHAHKT